MSFKRDPKKLAKFLEYVLGRHPEEFGLVPDPDGCVRVKSLLAVCAEEPGFAHVRQRDLDALALIVTPCPVVLDGSRIRARDRSHLVSLTETDNPPKILWLPIRRRAHSRVAEHGSRAAEGGWLTLTDDPAMAERIGRRLDRQYVLATVHTAQARAAGTVFRHGEGSLYITDALPPTAMTLPPVPEPTPGSRGAAPDPQKPDRPPSPGSVILNELPDPFAAQRKADRRRKKDPDWKRERRRKSRKR